MNRKGKLFSFGLAIELLAAGTVASAQIALPPAGIINTVAGNDLQGYSGDGGPARSASFGWLTGITTDSAGNFYVVDGNRIREVVASTDLVKTVAGNGTRVVSGDGGKATDAGLGVPSGVAVDGNGDLFISSSTTIRKVDASSGIISTIAGIDGQSGFAGDGGPASLAELNGASSVSIDVLGNLYFADRGNNRIRKINAANGQISTIAGDGVAGYSGDGGSAIRAELNSPGSVAIDGRGNLFICDGQNYRVREISVTTGEINTFAGTGTFGFSGDGGPATSAQFGQLQGMILDSQGNLYLGDYNNNRVREIAASTGTISTIAGDGATGLSGDEGPAVSAELETIYGIAVDGSGYLYILNSGVGAVRAVGPGAAQVPWSYGVTVTSSDPKPRMEEQVTLTARVMSNLGLPALSGAVTWYNGSTQIGTSNVDGTGAAILGTLLPSAGNVIITARYAGTPSGYGTLALPVFGYALSASPNAPVTVSAGRSAQFEISLEAFQGFRGEVDLSCVGLSQPGYCSFSTATANFTNAVTSQVVTLTVYTRNPAAAQSTSGFHSGFVFAALCPLLLLFARMKRVRSFLYIFILSAVGVEMSCGLSGCGASTATAPSATVTDTTTLSAGTHTFTVQATSGFNVVKLPITFVVQ